MKRYDFEKMKSALRFNGAKGSADQLYQWESACKVMMDYDQSISSRYALRYTGSAVSYEITQLDVRVVIMVSEEEFFVRRIQRDYPHFGVRALCSDLSYAISRNYDLLERGCGWDSTPYHISTVYGEVKNPVSRWVK